MLSDVKFEHPWSKIMSITESPGICDVIASRTTSTNDLLQNIGSQLMAATDVCVRITAVDELWGDSYLAATTPDGTVAITRSLLADLNGAELSFVLAHEIAHRVLQHHEAVIQGFLRLRSTLRGRTAWRSVITLCKQQELDADEFAICRLKDIGINVDAALAVMKKLEEHRRHGRSLYHFGLPHPPVSARRALIARHL